jgi:2-polyprenyl-3-methyl-5-hydroxy-6-metoxy-1,4-benzoquinol methylase
MLTIPLGETGARILGVDVDEKSLEVARANNPWPNVRFERRALETLADGEKLADAEYDVVVCSELLEHLDDPRGLVREIRRVLKDDGLCIVTVPNGRGPFELQMKVWRAFADTPLYWPYAIIRSLAREIRYRVFHGYRTLMPGTLNVASVHVNFFGRREIEGMFDQEGMRLVRMRGRSFLAGPFTDPVIGLVAGLDVLNAAAADWLPSCMASGWMFAFKKDGAHAADKE